MPDIVTGKPNKRLLGSIEVIESAFGKFKHTERKQALRQCETSVFTAETEEEA
jgi:hypothetical protein